MPQPQTERRWDATDVLFEAGRLVQRLALTLRWHRIVSAQLVCVCGRLPVRTLPIFGPRCEIAVEQWDRAFMAMRRLLRLTTLRRPPGTAIGRAEVDRRHRDREPGSRKT